MPTDRERKRKLKKLARLMNKQNSRLLPAGKPIIDLLDEVLENGELDFLLCMGTGPYTSKEAERFADTDKLKALFDTLKKKGFIQIRHDKDGGERFTLNSLITGWYEPQVLYLKGSPGAENFARKFEAFLEYYKRLNFFPLRNLQNIFVKILLKPNQSIGIDKRAVTVTAARPVPVGSDVRLSDSKIFPTKTVNEIFDEYGEKGSIALIPCVCRENARLIGDPCRLKIAEDSCIALGSGYAKPWVEYGYGRLISKQEALDVLAKARDRGAVHSVYFEKDDISNPEIFICNCCWDCCGLLRGFNKGASVVKYKCYYTAHVKNIDLCTGCGKCRKYCPTVAVSVKKNKIRINHSRCIGCGQCVHQCPEGVVELLPAERNVFLPLLKKGETRIV